MKSEIKEWLSFNDNEIGSLQYFVIEYIKENEKMFNKEKSFMLGVFSTQFQYNMRLLKEFINSNQDRFISDIVRFIEAINLYPSICKFTKEKFIESFENMDLLKKYNYLNNDAFNTSFFKRTEKENNEIEEISWKVFERKIQKYKK